MSLNHSRIASAAMISLKAKGFAPDSVPFLDTGKSALEHIVEAIAQAVIDEIKEHGVVKVTLDAGLATWMGSGVPVPQDGGLALQTSLVNAAGGHAYDKATGAME